MNARRMTAADYEELGTPVPTDVQAAERCSVGSCQRHGRCMYMNHPRCPMTVEAIKPKECEACDATDADGNEFCEGCDCCSECCNCTGTDCDCSVCEVRRENE